ncbi:hypothetical protein EJ08DRAFT_666435 [Tothia fuscella]|uniref:Uncharacterized protein n=1 Tax=Tothia fuscella TaxID=1048955 RepID=A0A9P4NEK5_9PEZI|nr:hypothetical protein EJ08DRAFT_666435 [Tothia fuscella]
MARILEKCKQFGSLLFNEVFALNKSRRFGFNFAGEAKVDMVVLYDLTPNSSLAQSPFNTNTNLGATNTESDLKPVKEKERPIFPQRYGLDTMPLHPTLLTTLGQGSGNQILNEAIIRITRNKRRVILKTFEDSVRQPTHGGEVQLDRLGEEDGDPQIGWGSGVSNGQGDKKDNEGDEEEVYKEDDEGGKGQSDEEGEK